LRMGPKKAKKSKAELEEERLAREEEERKAKIAEEKRIAEENEKRRLEELRIQAEHKKNREAELERLGIEYAAISDGLESAQQQLIAEEKNESALVEWLRYKDPSDEPDASSEKDMNTYISLLEETSVPDMKSTIELITRMEKISVALQDVWSDGLAVKNEPIRLKALENLNSLRRIMFEKLDIATVKLLQFADEQLNDRQEMNIEETAHKLSIGMWASYADIRPIRKSVHFESMGIQIDLQKQLLQQHDNYVFRMIRMPIQLRNWEAYNLPKEILADAMATGSGSGDGEGKGEGDDSPVPVATAPHPANSSRYVVGDILLFDILYAPAAPFHLRVRKWTMRDKSSASTKLRKAAYPSSVPSRMQLKIPSNVVMTDDMRIAVWNDEIKDWTEDGISDYQYSEANRTVHFYITTVGVLALVKNRVTDMPYKKWTLAPVVAKPVNKMIASRLCLPEIEDFSLPSPGQAAGASALKQDSFDGEEKLEAGDSTASVSDASNVFKTKTMVAESADPTTLAIAPKDTLEKYARLSVQTQSHEIVIDVIGPHCKLVRPNTPVFQDILGVLLRPGSLLSRLQRKGINLLPNAHDLSASDRTVMKDAVLEDQILKEIAQGASSMEYSSSSWNQSLNESQAGILVRESNVYTCFPQVNEYECVFVEMDSVSVSYNNTPELGLSPGPGGLKYTLVFGNEYGDKKIYTHVPRPGEISHLDMPRTLHNRATKEGLDRLHNVNQTFAKTVYTLLSLMKPYSLC